jgi:predicted amidohydrolase
MNLNRKPPKQPDLPLDAAGRPTRITTSTSSEYWAVLKRAEAGEFTITALESGRSVSGRNNSTWIFEVRYDNERKQT